MKHFHFISTDTTYLKEFNKYTWQNIIIKLHESFEKFERYLASKTSSFVFLDVDFYTKPEFLHNVNKLNQVGSKVVIVSKDKAFAYDAINAGAYNYILKSNLIKDPIRIICGQYSECLSMRNSAFNKIAIQCNDAIYYLDPNEIIRCKAESNYTWIIREKKNILIAKTLRKVEALLPKDLFYRTHRSHIVNLRHINMIRHEKGGVIVTSDNHYIPISRTRKSLFLDRINFRTDLK